MSFVLFASSRIRFSRLVMTTLAAMSLIHVGAAKAQDQRPNIVMVLVDDLGFGDLSDRRMPKSNALSSLGTRMNLYAHQNCMPTRAALFTGRYPHRYDMQTVWHVSSAKGLPTDEKILSERLADVGYTCGIFGKWHLGYGDRAQWPTRRGFTEFVGLLGGHFNSYGSLQQGMPNANGSVGHDHHNMHDLQWNEVPLYTDRYSTDVFRDGAVRFIEEHSKREKPFFLYVPFNAPHGPFAAPRKYVEAAIDSGDFAPELIGLLDEYPQDVLAPNSLDAQEVFDTSKLMYAAMVLALDDAVEKIYQTLVDEGVAENTLFVFASDNGVSYVRNPQTKINEPVGSSAPLRGNKGSHYEAGSRVANFIVWPNKITPGQEIRSNVWIGDLTKTFLTLAGASVPSNLDGGNLMHAIEANRFIVRSWGARRLIPFLIKWKVRNNASIGYGAKIAMVSGLRKYVKTVYFDHDMVLMPGGSEQLFDLSVDIGETKSLVFDPRYQTRLVQSRIEYELFGGDQLLEDASVIPAGSWQGYNFTLDFGFPDGTSVLESTIAP